MHMKTVTKVLLAVVIIIGIAVAWWLISPLFVTKRVSEELPSAQITPISQSPASTLLPASTPAITAEGTFTGFDKLHQASGTARIVQVSGKTYVRFEDDFTVTNGPDLFVYLGNNNAYDASANLGKLKGNEGSQNYEIPSSISINNYSEVWVWCRAFSVPFGKAVLKWSPTG